MASQYYSQDIILGRALLPMLAQDTQGLSFKKKSLSYEYELGSFGSGTVRNTTQYLCLKSRTVDGLMTSTRVPPDVR